jgi:nucleoid DNA-binding protein
MNESTEIVNDAVKSISTNKLIALVAASSGYHKYEVADILEHLAVHIAQGIDNDLQVKLEGVGAFSKKESKPRDFKSGLTGKDYSISTKISATLKPDTYLKNFLNRSKEKA